MDTNAQILVAWNAYATFVYEVAASKFETEVKPVLCRYGWKFLTNGEWFIIDKHGKMLYPEDIEHLPYGAKMIDILDAGVPGMPYNDLGSLMPNYDPLLHNTGETGEG